MLNYIRVIVATVFMAAVAGIPSSTSVDRTTAQRISEHNYPVETHDIHTEDGYILTAFRIPYSPKLQNQNKSRPAVFIQHGIVSSSDGWILNGPDNAIAYLFADAGYDVWLGNARGNTYSKKHETLSTSQPSFWHYTWNEIGLYDIPAAIDYVLQITNETALHYVGHSMGTTVFFVLMSHRPDYNAKIKTAHMLAPVAYASHMTCPLATIPAPYFGHSSLISYLLSNMEILPHNSRAALTSSIACSENSSFQPVCLNLLFIIFGMNSTHFNTTLLSNFFETHPAGISTNTFIHFAQAFESAYFRQYDYGYLGNLQKYNQEYPPEYDVSKIVAPVRLYYSDNDYLADKPDVKIIESQLPNVVESFNVPYPDWNHLDFLFGNEVKATLYDRIINAANHFEATGSQ